MPPKQSRCNLWILVSYDYWIKGRANISCTFPPHINDTLDLCVLRLHEKVSFPDFQGKDFSFTQNKFVEMVLFHFIAAISNLRLGPNTER